MTFYRPLGPATPWVAFVVCLSFAIALCYTVKAIDSNFYSNYNGFYTGYITVANLYAVNYLPHRITEKWWQKLIILFLTFPFALGKVLLLKLMPFNITPVFLFMQFWVPAYDFLLTNGAFFEFFKKHFKNYAKLSWFLYNESVAVIVTALVYYFDVYGIFDIVLAQNFLEGPLIWLILVGNFMKPILMLIKNPHDRWWIGFMICFVLGIISIFTFDQIFRDLWADSLSDSIDGSAGGDRDGYIKSMGSLFTRGMFSFYWTAMPYVQLKKHSGGMSDLAGMSITILLCPVLIILCGQLARWMTIFRTFEDEWVSGYNLRTIDFGFLIGNVGFVWNVLFNFYPFRLPRSEKEIFDNDEIPLDCEF